MKGGIEMATEKIEQSAKLIIKVQTGVNASGKPAYRQRVLANMNPALTDDEVLAIGQAIGGLQQHDIEAVSRQDNAVLAAKA